MPAQDKKLNEFKKYLLDIQPYEDLKSPRLDGRYTRQLNRHLLFGEKLPAKLRDRLTTSVERYELACWAVHLGRSRGEAARPRISLFIRIILPENDPLLEALLHMLNGQDAEAVADLRKRLDEVDFDSLTRITARNLVRFLNGSLDQRDLKTMPRRPARVMQIWDNDPPEDVAREMRNWRDAVGAENYVLFNQATAGRFIRKQLGATEARLFDQIWSPTSQSDMFRLVHILFEGGFYIDSDFSVQPGAKNVLEVGAADDFIMTQTGRSIWPVANGFFGFRPGHPVTQLCVEMIFRLWAENPNLNPMIYGPCLLRWAIDRIDPDGTMTYLTCSRHFMDVNLAANYKPSYKPQRHWHTDWANHPTRSDYVEWARS